MITKKKHRKEDPIFRKVHIAKLAEDAAPVSKAQFKVLKILYNKYGPRDWKTFSSLSFYDIQEKTLNALAEKKLIKIYHTRLIKADSTEVFIPKKVMITELGRQVVSYMIAYESLRDSFSKTGGVQKLK